MAHLNAVEWKVKGKAQNYLGSFIERSMMAPQLHECEQTSATKAVESLKYRRVIRG